MSETHWGYIVAAYALAFLTIGGVTLRIVLDHRRLRGELARLEQDRGDAA